MTKKPNTEIERKFLIRYPDREYLEKSPDCRIFEFEQTYLLCDDGSMRVRKSESCGKTEYIRNIKKRISDMTHLEDERVISEETYRELLLCADKSRNVITKTRYKIPFENHTMEIDIYPFWNDRAVLEVELSEENEKFSVPQYIEIIKEVTYDKRYSNKALAKEIINEIL